MSRPDIDKVKEDTLKGVDEIIAGITVDDIRTETMSIRIGGKLVKMEVIEEQETDEEMIRKELLEKFNEKLKAIRGYINEKAMDIDNVVGTYRNEYEKKERELQARLSQANIMPDINRNHANRGLSVVKGGGSAYDNRPEIYTWLYRATYKPTHYNGEPLDEKIVRKMITPIIIEVTTEKSKVIGIRVKKYIGDANFDHYHNNCWGDWAFQREKAETPDDILKVCEKASAILTNINGHSLATSNPRGLPRNSTLRKNIVRKPSSATEIKSTRRSDERTGLNEGEAVQAESVWST